MATFAELLNKAVDFEEEIYERGLLPDDVKVSCVVSTAAEFVIIDLDLDNNTVWITGYGQEENGEHGSTDGDTAAD